MQMMHHRIEVKERPMTRRGRGLLSMVNQSYNPLGMLQPFLLPAKLLLKKACRAELDWDDELTALSGMG